MAIPRFLFAARGAVWHLRLTRDVALFIVGAIGFFHELFFNTNGPERPMILTVAAAAMGLSVLGRASEAVRNGKNGHAS